MWIRSRKKSSGGGGGGTGGITITVTCDAAFAGKTITCTDGTNSFIAVCPSTSPYTVEFEGISAGTWTISGVVDGTTYESVPVVVANKSATLQVNLVINVINSTKWTVVNDSAGIMSFSDSGLQFKRTAAPNGSASACYNQTIDFSDYSTMEIDTVFTGDTTGGVAIGWSNNSNLGVNWLGDYTEGRQALVNGHNTIDISNVTGVKYLKYGTDSNMTAHIGTYTISSMVLIP